MNETSGTYSIQSADSTYGLNKWKALFEFHNYIKTNCTHSQHSRYDIDVIQIHVKNNKIECTYITDLKQLLIIKDLGTCTGFNDGIHYIQLFKKEIPPLSACNEILFCYPIVNSKPSLYFMVIKHDVCFMDVKTFLQNMIKQEIESENLKHYVFIATPSMTKIASLIMDNLNSVPIFTLKYRIWIQANSISDALFIRMRGIENNDDEYDIPDKIKHLTETLP